MIYKQQLFSIKDRHPELGDGYYKIEVEIPVEHNSLEGKWNVKEVKEVYFYHYKNPDIENTAVLITDNGSKAITGTIKALEKLNIPLARTLIEIPTGPSALKILRRLGGIGWTFVSDIVDSHLAQAALYGKRLENSEILEEFLQRGGRIKAVVLYNEKRELKIILSSRGVIYSQRNVRITEFATDIANIIKEFKASGLLHVK